jgi:hypothetical protein
MKNEKENISEEKTVAPDETASELEMPIWSVITFDEIAANSLTYADAAEKLEKLKAEKVSGLCVVTDETAARMRKSEKKK